MSPKASTSSRRKQRRYDNTVALRTPGQQQFAQIILRILRRIVR